MERNYDEVIAEMLIHLDRLESNMKKFGKRLDLTIQRMVKAEARLEKQEGRMEKFDAEFDSRVAKWGAEFEARSAKWREEFEARMRRADARAAKLDAQLAKSEARMETSTKYFLDRFERSDRRTERGEKLFIQLIQKNGLRL